ncbi:MAG: lipoate--protein ligase family protein [Actinobacteria bacterium]|nr:lipoate--protein ligase family protein [Actinomycetota bacterium]
MSIIKILPDLRDGGGAQMALDEGLLQTADDVLARRYTWAPPALSIGKFQELQLVPGLPFEVVRRPTGGRAVLHGEAFEWSFAVVFPPGVPTPGPRGAVDVGTPYGLVAAAFAAALKELGVTLDGSGEVAYRRSALCFSGALRYDICSRGQKVVAIAQARKGGRTLVHGSFLMERPPAELTEAVETLVGELWESDGLAASGVTPAPETIWNTTLRKLEATLRRVVAG